MSCVSLAAHQRGVHGAHEPPHPRTQLRHRGLLHLPGPAADGSGLGRQVPSPARHSNQGLAAANADAWRGHGRRLVISRKCLLFDN